MRSLFLLIMILYAGGCAQSVESLKTIWGSSTRALEDVRPQAIAKSYDYPYWEVFRSSLEVINQKRWTIFKKEDVKGYIVLMGIRGAVNTTEVGLFFVETSPTTTRVEVASLSTNAKRIVARELFHEIDVALELSSHEAENK